MNSKLERLTEERNRIAARIGEWTERMTTLDAKIMELENLEIRALMRTESLSLQELMDLVRAMQEKQRAAMSHKEDADDEEA